MRKAITIPLILAGISVLSACGTAVPLDEIPVIDRRSFSGSTGGDSADSGVDDDEINKDGLR
jgi:predicted small lipoprotein YifL